jgi:gamma-glutamylcyclotransferase (GGCT)/AIG2-like uncharacterized protein YtfP
MKMHKVYVYGTLMTGAGERVQVPGKLYDLGWFPGAKISTPECGSSFVAEVREVSDGKLKEFDNYEGYYESHPEASLYIRRPYLDGWIYEYNRQPADDRLIESGDWNAHKADKDRDQCIRDLYKKVEHEEEQAA